MDSPQIDPRAQAIVDFWFGPLPTEAPWPDERSRMWWRKDADFDDRCRDRFRSLHTEGAAGDLDHWREGPVECLALIILLDQLSRNMFRGTPQAFAQDPQALSAAVAGLDEGLDRGLHPAQRCFFRMPLMHSESLEHQQRCVKEFARLVETAPEACRQQLQNNLRFAERHRDIVARFGRFPHRNRILGRQSTAQELAFLTQPGSSF